MNIKKSPLFAKWVRLQTSYSQPDLPVLIGYKGFLGYAGDVGSGGASSSSFSPLLPPGDLLACRPREPSRPLCFVDGLCIYFALWREFPKIMAVETAYCVFSVEQT